MDYYENLEVGDIFSGGTYKVTKAEMVEFARKWDPRPIHIDDLAAQLTPFGEVIATSAYVVAIRTRLAYDVGLAHRPESILAGLGMEEKFPNPVKAGDLLTYRSKLQKKRESRSNPGAGIVSFVEQLLNQDGQPVLECFATAVVKKRPENNTET